MGIIFVWINRQLYQRDFKRFRCGLIKDILNEMKFRIGSRGRKKREATPFEYSDEF